MEEKIIVSTSEMGMKFLIKEAYKECKEIIRKEGTLTGAKCMCDKLTKKEWQEKFKGFYWTAALYEK